MSTIHSERDFMRDDFPEDLSKLLETGVPVLQGEPDEAVDGLKEEDEVPDQSHPWAEKAVLAMEEILDIVNTGDGDFLTLKQVMLGKVWGIYIEGFTSGREEGARSIIGRLNNHSHHGLQGWVNRNGPKND